MDYELNALFGLSETEPLEKAPVEVPDLPFDDYFFNVKKASRDTAAYSVNIQRDALSDELVGDCPLPFVAGIDSPSFSHNIEQSALSDEPVGDCAPFTEPLGKARKSDIKAEVVAFADAVRKGGRAGKYLTKAILKAGGYGPQKGMIEAAELFEEQFSLEEYAMVEKAIKTCDVPAFCSLLNLAFQRAEL